MNFEDLDVLWECSFCKYRISDLQYRLLIAEHCPRCNTHLSKFNSKKIQLTDNEAVEDKLISAILAAWWTFWMPNETKDIWQRQK